MPDERFDKVVMEIPGEPVKEFTPEGFRAIPIGLRVDALLKGHFKFFKAGQSISSVEALKKS